MPIVRAPVNQARALWARVAVEAFKKETGLTDVDGNVYVVADLLADLMHLCQSGKGTFGEFDHALHVAQRNFEEEQTDDYETDVEVNTLIKLIGENDEDES